MGQTREPDALDRVIAEIERMPDEAKRGILGAFALLFSAPLDEVEGALQAVAEPPPYPSPASLSPYGG